MNTAPPPPSRPWPARRRGLALVVAALAAMASGCPKPPPILNPRLVDKPEGIGNPTWTTTLPADLTRVRLHAHQDCVFVTAEKDTALQPTRVQLCVDPMSGEVAWVNTVELSGGIQQADTYFVTDNHLVYVNRAEAIGVARKTGKISWRFKDEGGLPIYSAFVEGGALVLSLGNRKLAVLDADSGAWVRGFALKDDALKQIVRVERGLLALLVNFDPEGKATPRLVAVPIGDARTSSGDPGALDHEGNLSTGNLPEIAPLWSREISAWSFDVQVVDGVIIGEFEQGQLWAMEGATGAELWRQPRELPRGALLPMSRALLLHRHVKIDEALPDSPSKLLVLGVAPRALAGEETLWSMELPTDTQLLGIEEGPAGDPRTLGATVESLFQFDARDGRLLWIYVFEPVNEPGYWSNASSNGEATFLFFEREGRGGALKRVPILID